MSISKKGSRVASRLIDYARFHIIGTFVGFGSVGPYDIILSPSPPLTIGLSAWVLGLIRRVPFIYNVQEIYPDIAISLGILRNRSSIRFFEFLESFIYKRAHTIAVISEWFRRRLLEKNVSESKLVMIPNFVDTDFIQPGPRSNKFSETHRLDEKFVVLYAGNIGLTQGFETILAAAQSLQDLSDVQIVIVGDGTRRRWLEEELDRLDISNVLLLPYQPRSMVPQIYASSDLCLVPLKLGTAQETFPSKIYTIMAAGKPVVASADQNSELAWVVQEAACGWAVPPDDIQALTAVIRESIRESKKLSQMGQRGRNYVMSNHSRQAVAKKYGRLVEEIVGKKES